MTTPVINMDLSTRVDHLIFQAAALLVWSIQATNIDIAERRVCKGLYGTLKRVVWYFEEGGVVL